MNKFILYATLLSIFINVECVTAAGAAEGGSGGSAMAFFNVTDALDITWGHAVNSRAKIQQAIDDDIMFLEADVLLEGQGQPNQTSTPIMAHPPAISSDATLRYFLSTTVPQRRGIKLDIKSDDAVRPALTELQRFAKNITQPVWINSDIFRGPGGGPPRNGSYLVGSVSLLFPNCSLSLGWTVSSGSDLQTGYTQAQVEEAEVFCRNLSQPVTFPVHAGLVRRSLVQLKWLLAQDPSRYSLTLWTSSLVSWDVEDMVYIRSQTEASQVYYDLPADSVQEIKRLEAADSAASALSSLVPVLTIIAVVCAQRLAV